MNSGPGPRKRRPTPAIAPLILPEIIIIMHRHLIALLAVALAGCGVEVAGTAATVGAARVEEAKQAQQNQERFEQRLDATMQAAQQRREAADQASQH